MKRRDRVVRPRGLGPWRMSLAPGATDQKHPAHSGGLGWQNVVVEAVADIGDLARREP